MGKYQKVLQNLELWIQDKIEQSDKRTEVARQFGNAAWEDKSAISLFNQRITQADMQIRKELDFLLRYPPHLSQHLDKLDEFHQSGDYDQSVFIMTKYPDDEGDPIQNAKLNEVIKTVRDSVAKCKFVPRMATDQKFQDMIWTNVEFYLVACGRGIAIIEDCYLREFNPNVAMEWGWMRAMGKKVLYLVEESFSAERADAAGFIGERFAWDNPESKIPDAVERFLST